MAKKKLPQWVGIVLALLLVLLVAVLLFQGEGRQIGQQSVATSVVEMPPVYEDFHYKDAINDILIQDRIKALEKQEHTKYVAPKFGVALVMDDVGYDLHALQRLLALPIPIAISILPDATKAKQAAELAYQHGQVVMLHLPMEPANPHYRDKMDSSFLRVDMDKQTIQAMFNTALQRVPYVQGMNNHMGSMLTTLRKPMDWVMDVCAAHNLFFIDSRTASKSVAFERAKAHQLTWGKRSIFLDHSARKEDMEKAWNSAQACAAKYRGCIMIGHPHKETLRFLEIKFNNLEKEQLQVFQAVTDVLYRPVQ